MALLSPGVESKETSISSTIVRSSTGRAALVGKFAWGPAYEIRQVTNEVELTDMFGKPDNDTASYVMSGINFLQYGNDLRVVRVIDEAKSKNATPIFEAISVTITGGSGYQAGDSITVTYNGDQIETTGKVTAVNGDGKITEVFIPSGKIIEKAKQVGDYPALSSGQWSLEISSTSGGSTGSLSSMKLQAESGVVFPNTDRGDDVLTGSTVQELFKKYNMPVISAAYPGEMGSTIEVEIVSKKAFDAATPQTIYPYGGERPSTAASVMQFGPQTDDQYCFIVRRDGIIYESVVLSTKFGDRDVYGNNIYMDDYFTNGSSNLIYAVSQGFPTGFSGILQFGGGVSSSSTVTAGQFNQGWDMFSDPEAIQIPLMIAGAVAVESDEISATVQKHAISVGDMRMDTVVFCSPTKSLVVNVPVATAVDKIIEWRRGVQLSNNQTAVENNLNVSSTYAFIDGNFKYQYDKYNDVKRWVPLSADIAGLCARTGAVSHPWMSPAGYNRGQILNCIKLAIEPRQGHRDRLYQEGINPVCGFSGGDGFILYGDKTATKVPTPFDRINVRSLFNMLKLNIGGMSKYRLFENNDNFTRTSFRMETSEYLKQIKSLGGLYDFRVVCDTTNNTPTVIDSNSFVAAFYLKPSKSINYISLSYVATATGTNFEEIIGA